MRDNRMDKFYQTKEWKDLRAMMLREHPLCETCLAKSPAEYSRAVIVHHVNEVRHRPDLALTIEYLDALGQPKRNLMSLCYDCHELAHHRAYKGRRGSRKEPINAERFD
jgi:5-methylcytosine-specific restriction protein A